MPAALVLPPHRPVADLAQRYRHAHDPVERSHWQIVWLLSTGHSAAAVAAVTNYSVNWVREIARRYRRDGSAGLGDRRRHNPGHAALLDTAGKAALVTALGGPAPDGGLWTGRQVAIWMSAYLGRAISPQRGWEYLRQVGFTPQQPRPPATHADPLAQAAFKKGGSPPPSPP